MNLRIDKQKKPKKQKQFKASYNYIEPVFEPTKIAWINDTLILSKISLDNS